MGFWSNYRRAIGSAIGLDLTHGQVHYASFLKREVPDGVRWLELGCGGQIVPDWAMPVAEQRGIANRASMLVGIDVDDAILRHPLISARVYGAGGRLPFADATFDLVTCNMVVEHFSSPQDILEDVYRVLRQGGRFVFHTPNYFYYLIFIASFTPEKVKAWLVWYLERRKESDRFKTYYRLNTERSIRKTALAANFHVERLLHRGSRGSFERLWLLGWLECFILRALGLIKRGAFQSDLIVVLRKAPAGHAGV